MRGLNTRRGRNCKRLRLTAMLYTAILWAGLVACTTAPPVKPTAPVLNPVLIEDKVCFTQEDAEALGVYIIELESCY